MPEVKIAIPDMPIPHPSNERVDRIYTILVHTVSDAMDGLGWNPAEVAEATVFLAANFLTSAFMDDAEYIRGGLEKGASVLEDFAACSEELHATIKEGMAVVRRGMN